MCVNLSNISMTQRNALKISRYKYSSCICSCMKPTNSYFVSSNHPDKRDEQIFTASEEEHPSPHLPLLQHVLNGASVPLPPMDGAAPHSRIGREGHRLLLRPYRLYAVHGSDVRVVSMGLVGG